MMTSALLLAFMAGSAIPIGGGLAWFDSVARQWGKGEEEFHHTVIAFGGGALFSAVALVLVPEGAEKISNLSAILAFAAGGYGFYLLDCILDWISGSTSQLVAMMSDFIPEAIALGASFASQDPAALLLALMIGLQNLPEGFNAYRELIGSAKLSPRFVLTAFCLLSLCGPLAAWVGLEFLAERESLLGGLMLFAAGGIFYITFEDIAPQAVLKNSRRPALGSVAGFALGLVGYLMTT